MHYEDLKLNKLTRGEKYWYGEFLSKKGTFKYPIADASLSEKDLEEKGLFVGRMFLGRVDNNTLTALDGFSFIGKEIQI